MQFADIYTYTDTHKYAEPEPYIHKYADTDRYIHSDVNVYLHIYCFSDGYND